MRENLKNEAYFVDAPSMEAVTEELIQGMKENADKVLVIGTGDTAPDSKVALYVLKKFGIDRLLVETPSYMHYLVSQKMMDELFFNYSCIYVGGQALTIGKFGKEFTSDGPPPHPDASPSTPTAIISSISATSCSTIERGKPRLERAGSIL